MNFVDKIILKLAVPWLRGKLEAFMGASWKGKTGAIGVMSTGLATILLGIACMVGEITGNPISGVSCPPEGCSLQSCIGMIILGFGVFTGGLSQYGNRDAVAKLEKRLDREVE